MTLFVISKTAVTPWMARESGLSLNQTVYLWRQADLQPLRWNSTSAARRELAPPQAKTKARAVATSRKEAVLQALPGELTIKSVEANMAKTAVGLFENPGSVDEVVRDLKASGIPQKDVRVLGEPREMAGSGVMSAPHTDFEVGLVRDLRAFGVLEADAEDYVQGVRRGGVMVFATGSGDKAEAATEIMNRHGAVEIEKISASRPGLPSADHGEAPPVRDLSVQTGRSRSPGGDRLFVW